MHPPPPTVTQKYINTKIYKQFMQLRTRKHTHTHRESGQGDSFNLKDRAFPLG